ncbi:hydrogenase maturation nickel metallochaperone HypA [bacterium]|nr:hydrogenase maturation nickel metallochaperone HypA [bacterium]
MHEGSIAKAIADTVLHHAGAEGAEKILSIEIEIGELTFLSFDQLKFWLDMEFKDTPAGEAEIKFTSVEARLQCDACGFSGRPSAEMDTGSHLALPSLACPKCGSSRIEWIQGRDAVVRKMQILKPD